MVKKGNKEQVLIAILVILLKEVNWEKETGQNGVVEASVHLGPADVEDWPLVLGVQQDIIRGGCLDSVGICRTYVCHPGLYLSAYMRIRAHKSAYMHIMVLTACIRALNSSMLKLQSSSWMSGKIDVMAAHALS